MDKAVVRAGEPSGTITNATTTAHAREREWGKTPTREKGKELPPRPHLLDMVGFIGGSRIGMAEGTGDIKSEGKDQVTVLCQWNGSYHAYVSACDGNPAM